MFSFAGVTAVGSSFERGALIWVPCPKYVWRSARVLDSSGDELSVEYDEGQPGENDGAGGGGKASVQLRASGNSMPASPIPPSPQYRRGTTISVPASPVKTPTPTAMQRRSLDIGFTRGMSTPKGSPSPRERSSGRPSRDRPPALRRNASLLSEGAVQFDDLTDVPELHEAAVLHALDVRFSKGIIYTLTGPVLIAVNPFRTLPGLYGPEVLRKYIGTEKRHPHVYGIAGYAFRKICEKAESQTILVSGESGSGKTETTKFVMQFLALAGTETAGDGEGSRTGSMPLGANQMSRVERQVLGSNPLLEAFGNAKTLRNDNSSRFGKFIELQFASERYGATPRLNGAKIRTYLLEKVRVILQQDGEKSFHIFYQALAGAQYQLMNCGSLDIDLDGFTGRTACSFRYLSGGRSGPSRVAHQASSNANYAEEFDTTCAAMRSVGLKPAEVSDIFKVVAAVLHLGNIDFVEITSENAEVKRDDVGYSALDITCTLLGVKSVDLSTALCTRSMQAPGEQVIRMHNDAAKAADTRDALAKHLYHGLFLYIVNRCNQSIGFQDQSVFCGVLDIFGFEFFDVNSFEQLCINYTNELLQQYFNTFIFENETTLYKAEGIDWDPQSFPDNKDIVCLLHDKKCGILPMLEEECFSVGGSSDGWFNKMSREHEFHENFTVVKHKQGVFVVEHFAGPVSYTAEGFLEKNVDKLSQDLLQCLRGSAQPFVTTAFEDHGRAFGTGSRKAEDCAADGGRVIRAQRYTVSSEFRQQLQELLTRIQSTSPHFVRCIKPNPKNQPYDTSASSRGAPAKPLLDRPSVAEQLSYQGVLEAIRVARAGYPVRYMHADFVREFRILASPGVSDRLAVALHKIDELENADKSGGNKKKPAPNSRSAIGILDAEEVKVEEPIVLVKELLATPELQQILPDDAPPVMGKQRVFLKQEPFAALRVALGQRRHAAIVKIQAVHRGHATRLARARFLWALLRLQSRMRGRLCRAELRRIRRVYAATIIEAGFRTLRERIELQRQQRAAVAVQCWGRMLPERRRLVAAKAAAIKLQKWWRSLVKRRRWRTLQARVLRIQRMWRGHTGRRRALDELVHTQRLRMAVRCLIRLRRKNLKYRAWRQQVMAAYKGTNNKAAPPKETLVRQLLAARDVYQGRFEQAVSLKQDCDSYAYRLGELRPRVWLRMKRCFMGSAPAEDPSVCTPTTPGGDSPS